MKKCAFFDLDKTLYDGFTTSSFYLFLVSKNLVSGHIAREHDKLVNSFNSKEVGYKELCERAVALSAEALKGRNEKIIDEWSKMFLNENGKFFPWVKDLLKMVKEKEYESYLISGTINPFLEAFTNYLDIDNFYSSELEIENGIYTGRVKKVLHFDEKKKLINDLMKGVENCEKIGFGDSTGDVEMLSHMDEAFVYEPFEEEMIEIANEKGWNLVSKDNILEVVRKRI